MGKVKEANLVLSLISETDLREPGVYCCENGTFSAKG